MIGLPQSTGFNKRIPKQKFYENITVTPQMKRIFVEQIKVIYWRNKIAPSTINLAPGELVTEIEVFEVKLNSQPLDTSVLKQIDKEIPYHIIFLLEYDGKYQAWTAYKEAAGSGTFAFKVGNYYHTEWLEEAALPLKIDGLNMDKVYENFVRQIATAGSAKCGVLNVECGVKENNSTFKTQNSKLNRFEWSDELSLKENVERDEKRKALEKQIAALETKMRREKQLNRQMEMNAELKRLKKAMDAL